MNKKLLLLATLTVFGLILAVYSKDVVQKNPETIFLTEKGIQEFKDFQKVVPEKKTIVVKIISKERLNFSRVKKLEIQFAKVFYDFPEFETLSPLNLYPNIVKFEEGIKPAHEKTGPIKLLGDNFFAYLVIEKEAHSNFVPMLDRLLSLELEGAEIKIAGIPYINYLLDKYSASIKEKVFPIMFAVSFFIILLATRNFLTSIFLFLPCLFSSVICLSTIKILYGNMNMITSIVPLMCFTISLAVLFHMYFTLVHFKNFDQAFQNKKTPIYLMIITTCIGFGSLAMSEIQAIKEFGLLSAGLIVVTSFFSLLWIYSADSLLLKGKGSFLKIPLSERFFSKTLNIFAIGILTIISLVMGSYAYQKIKIVTDATEYFPKDSGLKDSIDSVNKTVAGTPIIEIILPFNQEIGMTQLKSLDQLERTLRLLIPKKFQVKSILSANSMVKAANKQYSGSDSIPDLEVAYRVLYSRLKPTIKEAFPIERNYKITLLGSALNVADYEKLLVVVKSVFKSKGIEAKINGLYYNLMIAQKAMIGVLTKSFLLAVLIVSVIAVIYLRKIRVFFIFLFVNIVPVFISLFLLHLLNFSLNIATVMTYSIAIGMIVDSSFHIIHSFKDSDSYTFQDYLVTTVRPILGSSLLLIISFGLFGFNGFLPIKQFGINLGIILFLGLIFDLFVLPTLYLGNPKIREIFQKRSP